MDSASFPMKQYRLHSDSFAEILHHHFCRFLLPGYQILHHPCEIVLLGKCTTQSTFPFSSGVIIFIKAMEPCLGQTLELQLHEMLLLVVHPIMYPLQLVDLKEPVIHI